MEEVNLGALRYIFKGKSASYQDLLERIGLPSIETRRIQDMLTINGSISDKAPPAIRDKCQIQGRGPGGPPPLFLDRNEARSVEKNPQRNHYILRIYYVRKS